MERISQGIEDICIEFKLKKRSNIMSFILGLIIGVVAGPIILKAVKVGFAWISNKLNEVEEKE